MLTLAAVQEVFGFSSMSSSLMSTSRAFSCTHRSSQLSKTKQNMSNFKIADALSARERMRRARAQYEAEQQKTDLEDDVEKKEIDEDENERVMEKFKATNGFESRKKILDIEEPVGMSAIKIPDAISARERIRNSRAETQRDSEIIEKGMTSSEGKESVRMSVRKIPDAISSRGRMRNTEANSH